MCVFVMTIVLGSLQAATDILDKRGNIYSSRPRNIMGLVSIIFWACGYDDFDPDRC
jgi:hypothetical protein